MRFFAALSMTGEEKDHGKTLDGIPYLDRLDRPEDLREVRPDDFAEAEAVVE